VKNHLNNIAVLQIAGNFGENCLIRKNFDFNKFNRNVHNRE